MDNIELIIREIVREEIAAAEDRLHKRFQTTPDKDLTFQEACAHLNMSEYTLRKLVRMKRIPHRVYGSEGSKNPRYLFSQQRLDQWKREEEERNYIREATS